MKIEDLMSASRIDLRVDRVDWVDWSRCWILDADLWTSSQKPVAGGQITASGIKHPVSIIQYPVSSIQ